MASYNDIFCDDEVPSWLTGKEDDSQGSQVRVNCILGFSVFFGSSSAEYGASQVSGDACVHRRARFELLSSADHESG
ncbi:hypothetical protein R1flu_011959 [Riccia fluitans]|uniref:Uncharacterized protein n=1 Tax=Riccia fluitans TaxID=41844 RepID=A0ABD1ZDE9_9MARC